MGAAASPEPSRPLLRLLRRYATKVEVVRTAELDYRGVVLTESLRHETKLRRASAKRIDAALGTLAEAVVDLQDAQAAVLSLAKVEGLALGAVCALDTTFASANREYAGYLAARTYDQVHEVAKRGPFRGGS